MTKVDDPQALLTLPLFMAWVKEQKPYRSFCFTDVHDCSVARYLKDHGQIDVNCGVGSVNIGKIGLNRVTLLIPQDIQDVMEKLFIGAKRSATYGELLMALERVDGKED